MTFIWKSRQKQKHESEVEKRDDVNYPIAPENVYIPPIDFEDTLNNIFVQEECAFKKCKNAEEESWVLDFFIDMIADDIRTSIATGIFYRFSKEDKRYRNPQAMRQSVFPFFFLKHEPVPGKISSGDKTVLAFPWEQGRLGDAIANVHRGKYSTEPDFDAPDFYIPELRLIIVGTKGNHIACATVQEHIGREYAVNEYSIEWAFPKIITDGEKWYNKDDPEWNAEVKDKRFALMYAIAQKVGNFARRQEKLKTRKSESLRS